MEKPNTWCDGADREHDPAQRNNSYNQKDLNSSILPDALVADA